MRKHNVVRPAIYHERRFRSLGPTARHLLLTLLTCPETNLTPVLILSLHQLIIYTGMTKKTLLLAMGELVRSSTIWWDNEVDMIYMINHLRYNPLVSPRLEVGYLKLVDSLPTHEFKEMALSALSGEDPDRVYGRVSIPLKEKEKEKEKDLTLNLDSEREEKVLKYLNKISGRGYKTSPDLKARLKEGATVEQLTQVINFKANEYRIKDNMMYLRPSTLFGKNNFVKFLSDSDGWDAGAVMPVENRVGMTDSEMEIIKRMEAS